MGLSIVSRIGNVLPGSVASLSLPVCTNRNCPRPPTVWQRWWARKEGVYLEGQWYCSAECLRSGLLNRIEHMLCPRRAHPQRRCVPLGLILFGRGLISEYQLRDALAHQREAGAGRIGEWLVRLGYARSQDVTAALAVQQNCPVFARMDIEHFADTFRFPHLLARTYGGLPVHFNTRTQSLLLAFAAPLRQSLLGAAAHILQCEVVPCIIAENHHWTALERWESSATGEAVCIEGPHSSIEISFSIASYAEQTGAETCSMARCEDHLWVRLSGEVGSLDLLFRVVPKEQPTSLC